MSLRRRLSLAVLLAVTGHQLALAAGRVATGQIGLQAADHEAAIDTSRRHGLTGLIAPISVMTE